LIEKIDDKTVISVLGFEVEKENAYGRLICDNSGNLLEIVEVKEATEAQKKVKDIKMLLRKLKEYGKTIPKQIILDPDTILRQKSRSSRSIVPQQIILDTTSRQKLSTQQK
jgi:bifunctional N-acetylglucosamine-1-phosphate-uridyltransferase/glucosamine-1-phosphate-acetyltransferase GlmU-like protein